MRRALTIFASALLVAAPAFAQGGGGHQAFSSPLDWNHTVVDTSHVGSKLDLTKYNQVYDDDFTAATGSTGVACDIGTETLDANSGNHNWYALNTIFGGGSIVHTRQKVNAGAAVISCPAIGQTKGVSLSILWNSTTSQYEGAAIYANSHNGYGPNYTNGLWYVRARFPVPPSNLYPWVAIWFDSNNVGVPANTYVQHMEWDGFETFPPTQAVLTGTITGGSGGANGTYPQTYFSRGSGGGFWADVTVSGGAMTALNNINGGNHYAVNDVLAPIGIPGLTGASYKVNTRGTAATVGGLVDMGLIEHIGNSKVMCGGHISAPGTGGTNGFYPGKVFTGGTGFSFKGDVTVSGGSVVNVLPNEGFRGGSYTNGDVLTTTGITGLTGFQYTVDNACYFGPSQLPSADRGSNLYYSPTSVRNVFDGQWHNYETVVTPNWIIEYFDETEVGRIQVYGDDERLGWFPILDNVAINPTAALGTTGVYTADFLEMRIYQCKVGVAC